ncbi:MAG: helix-turn-helix domain-containing protein [Clostridia bacterium]|nr:helix-turn-helix domain-containing protein [Clostridia bacterium]
MIILNDIQEKISLAIKKSNLSQSEIAKRIGVRQQQISCYLYKQKTPTLDTFANLCEVLDLDPVEILCLKHK